MGSVLKRHGIEKGSDTMTTNVVVIRGIRSDFRLISSLKESYMKEKKQYVVFTGVSIT